MFERIACLAEKAASSDVDRGDDAATALAEVIAADPNSAFRQFGVAALSPTSPTGVTVATFSGGFISPQACGMTGPTYAVQANLQSSSAVCQAMAAGFASTTGSLARRLLAALEAGTPVANDQRGEFSASIRVFANSWLFSQFTPISADASVERSSHWQEELSFNLDSYLAWWTTGDSRDLVELTPALATSIQAALQRLGYFKGKVDGTWSGETENALFNFSLNNVGAPVSNRVVNVHGTLYIDGPFADYVVQGEARGVLRPASGSAATPDAGTRSIVAADPASSQVGIAVVSFPTGVPPIVPVGEPGVIVANQAIPNYATARAVISGVEQGTDASSALANAIASDSTAQYQQFAVAALSSSATNGVTVATYTGSSVATERSAISGPTYAAVADIQTSSSVAGAMGSAYAAASGSLPRRLLAALLAGTSAGHDRRGEYSACIRVYSSTWSFADFTPISAESSVDRSRSWQDDLTFGLDAYLSFWTPGDPADLVPLTSQGAIDILTVLTSLGYYSGRLDGSWNGQAENALNTFSQFNLAFIRDTVKQNGSLFIDGPLAEYIVMGAARGVLRPFPGIATATAIVNLASQSPSAISTAGLSTSLQQHTLNNQQVDGYFSILPDGSANAVFQKANSKSLPRTGADLQIVNLDDLDPGFADLERAWEDQR